ncbi:WD repeat-containing protein 6 [Neocloeon triangulifer]|uniref:WD repeat-containing protein 6 n=1 Tax=Neocloeon triangulifer TaxID=2078957 RepID=UPI00286EB9F3|nr:WD repeat-containing protein 6 [Neocloeon triangulifer]
MKSTNFESTVRITTDVTALKILNNRKILAGIGGFIHVFILDETGSATLDRTVRVLEGQKIHGFCEKEEKLVVFGGRQFLVVDCRSFTKVEKESAFSQWIQAAQWLEDKSVAFALSNNSLVLWKDGKISQEVICPIQCIIYSALLLGTNWDSLVAFSGTVFSEVLIWNTSGHVLNQLKGHKGVIFSISYDEQRQHLLTSSDDRSVRVWQQTERPNQFEQVQELYGHQSRVWRALPTKMGLVSIGEDSVICQWDESGKVISKFCAHQGGSVRSADIFSNLLVTGGADGGIMCWKLSSKLKVKQSDLTVDLRRVLWNSAGQLLLVGGDEKLYLQDSIGPKRLLPNYAVQLIDSSENFTFMSTVEGVLTIVKGDSSSLELAAEGKVSDGAAVLSLVLLNTSTFLISLSNGERVFWSHHDKQLKKIASYVMGPRTKGASTGILIETFCLIGDQEGFLQLFDMSRQELVQNLNLKSEGITGLCQYRGLIWASCKEGRLLNLILNKGNIEVINAGQPRLGMLAGLEVLDIGLLLYSFHKEYFSAWSWDQQRPIFRLHCPGGGHRSWSFKISDQKTLCFAFIRHKNAFYLEKPMSDIMAPAIRIGLHLNLVNCMVPLDDGHLLSGGEDGSLRIYKEDVGTPLTVIQAHLSSVKSLLKSKSILVSGGGRAQITIWKIFNIGSNLVMKSLISHMLLENGDKPDKTPWRDTYQNPRPDPETRYMSFCKISHEDECLVFLAACSDSFLRLFEFCDASLELKKTIALHKSCVIAVSSSINFVASGSSDGIGAVWNKNSLLSEKATPLWSGRLHQGGVTSIVVTDEKLLLSGGDDGILRISTFANQLSTIHLFEYSNQVTGIEVFANFAISTTSGQKVSVWENDSSTGWCKKWEKTSEVSDLQGSAIIKSTQSTARFSVFGRGNEVLQLNFLQ